MDLTIVIPFFNGHEHIGRLLDSIPADMPVVLVDDQSDVPYQSERKNLRVIRPEAKGYFTGAVNIGVDACETDVLVLNQDVWFEGTGWLDLLASHGGEFAAIGESIAGKHPAWPYGYIHGTFMFIRRDAWKQVGPMNQTFYPLWGSTCEWQLRACRKGYRALPVGKVPGFYHAREGSYGSSIQTILKRNPRDRGLFIRTPPAISVVISAYNYGRFLQDAVNSLIGGENSMQEHIGTDGQTFQSFEVIIVDDGSLDNTEEIGKSLADPWKGVRYIRRSATGGTPAANNTGIGAANAKTIAMMCADDMMSPPRLERMYALLEANPHSIIFDDMRAFSRGKWRRHQNSQPDDPEGTWRMPPYDFEKLLHKNGIHSGIMFAKSAWEEVGGYSEEMRHGREDWQINVAFGIAGYCGVHLRDPLYLYRRQGQNRTERNTTPHHRQQFTMQMRSLYPNIYRGERPMGCCGPTRKTGRNSRSTSPDLTLMGAEGMDRMEYIGNSAGTQTWQPDPSRKYEFGLDRPFGYVDSRDTAWFLQVKDRGRKAFRLVPSVAPVKSEAKEFVPEPVALEELEIPFDPRLLTIKELRGQLADIDDYAVLQRLLDLEIGDDERVGALKAIEQRMTETQ